MEVKPESRLEELSVPEQPLGGFVQTYISLCNYFQTGARNTSTLAQTHTHHTCTPYLRAHATCAHAYIHAHALRRTQAVALHLLTLYLVLDPRDDVIWDLENLFVPNNTKDLDLRGETDKRTRTRTRMRLIISRALLTHASPSLPPSRSLWLPPSLHSSFSLCLPPVSFLLLCFCLSPSQSLSSLSLLPSCVPSCVHCSTTRGSAH